MTTLVVSASAAARRAAATAFLIREGRGRELSIVAATTEIASDLARAAAREVGATFGWRRASLGRLAVELAADTLARDARTPVSALADEALAARVALRLRRDGRLGRFAPVGELPGLSRALGRTLRELRLAGVVADDLADDELAAALRLYEAELTAARLADRAHVLVAACDALRARPSSSLPLCLLDVPVWTTLEARFVGELARGRVALATAPSGDDRSVAALSRELGVTPSHAPPSHAGALGRLQRGLFEPEVERGPDDDSVSFSAAAGEALECVEIARCLQREAHAGGRFDQMAVLTRSGETHRAHLVEALRRAGVPAHFADGARRPDPSGRALLALIGCAEARLSARRFAEYLSLGVVPRRDAVGAPIAGEDFSPPDDEQLPRALRAVDPHVDPEDDSEPRPDAPPPVRAPRMWERLLVESAVIGGLDRWTRRLDGLRAKLELELAGLKEPDTGRHAAIERELGALAELGAFALPILRELSELPQRATWGEHRARLTRIAALSIADPSRVLSVLAELAPMDDVADVSLSEVRLVLTPRLTELSERPSDRREGRVFVGPVGAARGLSFEVVCVAGLAERVMPRKVVEDPLLPDRRRRALGLPLSTNTERSEAERLALRLAVGAATRRVVASYSFVDGETARPRLPSFYALELARAAEGELPDFATLSARARTNTTTRRGWPAPAQAIDAIDDAEHDLSLLDRVLREPPEATVGTARYLLGANPHLARALRARGRRYRPAWFNEDGLVKPAPEAQELLARHALGARSYSATALQGYAACPYMFFLSAVLRLSPREDPEPIEEIGPLDRGSLVHDVLFRLLRELRAEGKLPISARGLDDARARMERLLGEEAARYRERLAPAIPRVWDDGVEQIRADLWVMLRRWSVEHAWVPAYFELGFGPLSARDESEKDEASRPSAVALDCGLQVRGSIDLVERRADGALRASDYKTGKARSRDVVTVKGGEVLQPVLYSLVLEKMFPGATIVGGRLYYCTSAGQFLDVEVPLGDAARDALQQLSDAIGGALSGGFLPAYPKADACRFCNFNVVCGTREHDRTSRKESAPLARLRRIRDTP